MKTTNTSIAPIRKEPNHRSEMVSQVLYGEKFEILEYEKDFSKIKMKYDGYEGWVSNSQISDIDKNSKYILNKPFMHYNNQLLFCGSEMEKPISEDIDIFTLAKLFEGAPYLWGGRTVAGIDCSGYMQIIFKAVGIKIPRDSGLQAQKGEKIEFGNHREGDLAFFKENERIMHVGLILKNNKIIHASGCVRIDNITNKGIFTDVENMTHSLSIIKRIIR